MVGEAKSLKRASAAIVILAAAWSAASLATTLESGWIVDAACRDGQPQGPYQLRSADGRLRVAGAFNEGRRTGSFIFWSDNGVRVAHIPFDDDVNGTVAIWYPGAAGREPQRHVESVFHHGARDGLTRTWFVDGRLRAQTEYAGGRIVAASAWDERGAHLDDEAAREVARRDAADADAALATLDELIRTHLPSCR